MQPVPAVEYSLAPSHLMIFSSMFWLLISLLGSSSSAPYTCSSGLCFLLRLPCPHTLFPGSTGRARKPPLPPGPQAFSAMCLPAFWIVCCICLLTSCLVFITANRGGKRWSYFIPRAFSLTQPHLSFAVPVLTHPFPYLRLCPLISSSFVLFSSARQQ